MPMLERAQLLDAAKAVLARNWTGHFTKPAPYLYPHQWSWDSAFIALAYAHYDQPRAEEELRALFAAQWTNGLLPHIVFNPAASGYFPGPEVWCTHGLPHAPADRSTSGIVQPPVHATAALHVYRYAQDQQQARRFLADLLPGLHAWHAYLYRDRDPRGEGLVAIRHPWESGQDNSPLWDSSLQRIAVRPEQLPAYRRVDTTLVDAADRPTQAEYDRYIYLVTLFADQDYDEAHIAATCPFLVQDVLFNTLLCQANRDLAEIARVLGEDAAPYEEWAERTARAIDSKLWDEAHGTYVDWDLAVDAPIDVHVAAGFTPLYAGIPTQERAARMYAYLNSPSFCPLEETCFPVPSYDRQAPGYSPQRYWRGPVWINVDWLLYHGLRRYGYDAYATRVQQAMVELVAQHGFYEYFNPETGAGHGSDEFSWTAALLLDLLLGGTAGGALG